MTQTDCKKCLKFEWQQEKFCINDGLFKIEGNPIVSGDSLFPFGFIINLLEPRSELFVDFGIGVTGIQTAGGGSRLIFNHLYGKGDYSVCIIARKDNDLRWQACHFDVSVKNKEYDPEIDLITGFFQSKTAGQMASGASGLDVAFSLSHGTTKSKTIQWYFEKDDDGNFVEDTRSRNESSTNYVYKNIGDHEGKIVLTDFQNSSKTYLLHKVSIIDVP